jgi:hypothetical protein
MNSPKTLDERIREEAEKWANDRAELGKKAFPTLNPAGFDNDATREKFAFIAGASLLKAELENEKDCHSNWKKMSLTLQSQLAEGEKSVEPHRENYLSIAFQNEKLKQQLQLAREALMKIYVMGSDGNVYTSDKFLDVARTALAAESKGEEK